MARVFRTWQLVVLFVSCAVVMVLVSIPGLVSSQGAGTPITGYAWSDNIGWIDLSCKNQSGVNCSTWGLYVTSGGAVSGYAWSENVGWVSAEPSTLVGCPTAPCSATLTSTALTGWLRVIAGGTSQSGAWDGFISLNGAGYGVQYSAGNFSPCSNGVSCAWGDKNLGWVDFSNAHSTYNTCNTDTTYTCQEPPDAGGVYRIIVTTATDNSCVESVSTYDCRTEAPYRYCSPGSSVCHTPPITPQPSGSLTGNLTVKPSLVSKNATTTIYWNISNVNYCTLTGTDGTSWGGSGQGSASASSATVSCTHGGAGCTSLPITKQTFYTLTCIGLDGDTYTQDGSVNIIPDFQEK